LSPVWRVRGRSAPCAARPSLPVVAMMTFKKKSDEDAKPVEQEIAELQRQFRMMENHKRKTSDDAQGHIRKQRATIEKLTRENRKMKAELKESRQSNGSQAEGRMSAETIQKLNKQRDVLLAKMDDETRREDSLEANLTETNQQIFSIRGDMAKNGGVTASLDNSKAVAKQIRILENRLDKALQKFNEAIAANRQLREQIDTLRRERVVFDDIYRKLENELQQKKKEMANIIEQANAAYEARDAAQAQMAALKQQADREHIEFEKEWKELGKLIANDKKMKEFMKSKVQRNDDAQAVANREEEQKRKRALKQAWDMSQSMAMASASQEKVRSYEEAFAQIQYATGICDLDELVNTFIHAEDQNFHLFKYNTELQADIEKLEQQIADYKEEYVQLSGTSSKREDTEKVKILEMLEEKCADIEHKGKKYEEKHQETSQTLEGVRRSINMVFEKVGCSTQTLPSGCGDTISEANMMHFLAAIEDRTNELLKVYDSTCDGETDFETTRPRFGNTTASLQVNKLPSTVEDYSEDEDEDEDEDQRPFTVEELKAKTKLKKRVVASKGKPKGRG